MTDFIPFNILLNEAEKRKEREMLEVMYQNWRASGGVPTVITKENLRSRGIKKPSKNVAIGSHYVGSYKIGERQAPQKFWTDETRERNRLQRGTA